MIIARDDGDLVRMALLVDPAHSFPRLPEPTDDERRDVLGAYLEHWCREHGAQAGTVTVESVPDVGWRAWAWAARGVSEDPRIPRELIDAAGEGRRLHL